MPGLRGQQRASTTAASGSRSTATTAAPMPTATAGVSVEARAGASQQAGGGAEVKPGERRAAAEAGQRDAPGHALEDDQQRERPSDQRPASSTRPGSWSWPENSTSSRSWSVVSREGDREPGDGEPGERAAARTGAARRAAGAPAPRRKIAHAPSAMATASGIVQRKSATSGRANVGQRERAQRVVARAQAGPRAHADGDQRADARRQQPRRAGRAAAAGRSSAAASMRMTAPISGEPKMNEIAAKLARRRDDGHDLRGASLRSQAHGEDAEPGAERDERRLGPEHDAEADRRERGQDDARAARSAGCGPRLEPVGGLVAAGAREPVDRERGDEAREREDRERPPHRRAVVVAELRRGSVVVDPDAGSGGRARGTPTAAKRHDEPDDRGHDEEDQDEPALRGVAAGGPRARGGRAGGRSGGRPVPGVGGHGSGPGADGGAGPLAGRGLQRRPPAGQQRVHGRGADERLRRAAPSAGG